MKPFFYTCFFTLLSFLKASEFNTYATNFADNTVSVINDKNEIIATISVQSDPFGVTVSPDGKFIYVSNLASSTISVISAASNQVTTTIDLETGSQPSKSACTSDGNYLYVVDEHLKTVSVINTSTYDIANTIALTQNSAPFDIAILSNNSYAYVTDTDNSLVSLINIASQTLGIFIPVGDFPTYEALTPDENYLYVANNGAATISVINTTLNQVEETIDLSDIGNNPNGIAITPNGKTAYVAMTSSDCIAIIDTNDMTATGSISLESGAEPQDVAISADGKTLYATCRNINKIAAINTETNGVTYIGVGDNPTDIATTPGPAPSAPTNFRGESLKNNFCVASEFYNQLTWTTTSTTPFTNYLLYRNGSLIATLSSEISSYEDHNRPPHQSDTYSLVALNSFEKKSTPATTVVKTE